MGYCGWRFHAEETVHGVKNARVMLYAVTTIRNVGASGYTDVGCV